jgi:hypothetical protein
MARWKMNEYIETTSLDGAAREFVPVSGPAPSRKLSDTDKALNRIAAALERLADVYLYVNDPDVEEGERPESSLPGDFRGMR